MELEYSDAPTPLPEPLHPKPAGWMVIGLFGLVAVCVAVTMFSYLSRCPCEKKRPSFTLEATPSEAKPFVEPTPSLKSTVFVLDWRGDEAPTKGLRVHFLLNEEPYSTFSCNARDIFGSHGRVRVTLPLGGYMVRAVFGETQSVCNGTPQGGLVTLTESTMACQKLEGEVAAAEVNVGVCSKDK